MSISNGQNKSTKYLKRETIELANSGITCAQFVLLRISIWDSRKWHNISPPFAFCIQFFLFYLEKNDKATKTTAIKFQIKKHEISFVRLFCFNFNLVIYLLFAPFSSGGNHIQTMISLNFAFHCAPQTHTRKRQNYQFFTLQKINETFFLQCMSCIKIQCCRPVLELSFQYPFCSFCSFC